MNQSPSLLYVFTLYKYLGTSKKYKIFACMVMSQVSNEDPLITDIMWTLNPGFLP